MRFFWPHQLVGYLLNLVWDFCGMPRNQHHSTTFLATPNANQINIHMPMVCDFHRWRTATCAGHAYDGVKHTPAVMHAITICNVLQHWCSHDWLIEVITSMKDEMTSEVILNGNDEVLFTTQLEYEKDAHYPCPVWFSIFLSTFGHDKARHTLKKQRHQLHLQRLKDKSQVRTILLFGCKSWRR